MVNSFVARGPRQRDDRGAQRVRDGREQPRRRAPPAHDGVAFQWHNYGKSTIGSRADIENVPIDRLQAFYRTCYQPDNAVLIVAGKFDEAEGAALVGQALRAMPKPRASCCRHLHRGADAGRRARVTLRARRRQPGRVRALPRAAAAATPTTRRSTCSSSPRRRPAGRLHRALVQKKARLPGLGRERALHDRATCSSALRSAREQKLADARERLLEVVER